MRPQKCLLLRVVGRPPFCGSCHHLGVNALHSRLREGEGKGVAVRKNPTRACLGRRGGVVALVFVRGIILCLLIISTYKLSLLGKKIFK